MVRKPIEGVVYPSREAVGRYAKVLGEDTLGGALHAAAVAHVNRIAVISPDGKLTYRELDALSDKAAAALLRLGLKPLDRVLLQLGNVLEFFYAMYGCFKAGLIPICALTSHREAEIGFLAPFTDAKAHIVQGDLPKADLVSLAVAVQKKSPVQHIVVARGAGRAGILSFKDMIDHEDAAAGRKTVEALDLDPWNVAIFQLSGGTT